MLLQRFKYRFSLLRQIVGDHAEDIAFHDFFFQKSNVSEDFVIRRLILRRFPVFVMEGFRAVQRNADEEIPFPENICPFFVQGQAVGLQGAMHLHAGAGVFFEKRKKIAEKIFPGKERFAPLKGERKLMLCVKKGPSHQLFQGFLFHQAKGFRFPPAAHIPVKAILAAHIAKPRCGLDHHGQWGHMNITP